MSLSINKFSVSLRFPHVLTEMSKTCELLKIETERKSNLILDLILNLKKCLNHHRARTLRFDFVMCTRLHISEELRSNEVES